MFVLSNFHFSLVPLNLLYYCIMFDLINFYLNFFNLNFMLFTTKSEIIINMSNSLIACYASITKLKY